MQLLFVVATHSAALLTNRLFKKVDGVKEKGCGGVPIANETPRDEMAPATADTELFVQGRRSGMDPFGQAMTTVMNLFQKAP